MASWCGSQAAGQSGGGQWKAAAARAGRWPSGWSPMGETVLDVLAKLAARVRVYSRGHGRKTGKDDAVSIGLARFGWDWCYAGGQRRCHRQPAAAM
jgi:hypothetical protein